MKRFSFALVAFAMALFATAAWAPAETDARTDEEAAPAPALTTFEIDQPHTKIGFSVRHLAISTVDGEFTNYEADLKLDPENLETLQANITIDASSVDTDNQRRDDHLRSPDFFEVEEHPEITFVSKEVRNIDGQDFELVGDLTIRGITKEIVLEAEMRGPAMLMEKQRVGFTATAEINRTDFGLTWNRVVEAGSLVVGEEVELELEVEAVAAEA